jgi:inhibitor of KinA sporulation pathway (predicted exonuclease)
MKNAMQLAGLFMNGGAHRALDDAKNISKLLLFILSFENIKRQKL